ncbi:hypothetical protein WMY93_027156 [Mugilogobius chulae]|uniref:Uncharacterized protein n=1 Tax=Mugilogobius chulae TaxID=88201 RepID=A0AAW0MS52_9GOBI
MDVPRTLHSHCLINTDRVAELVAEKPALIPFLSSANEDVRGFRKELVLTLCRGLERVMTQRCFSAGYDPCWQAFQLELALEEYHHGQPRTPAHGQFSVALGTSSTNARSLTRTRGILGLAPHTSASMGLSPPPLTIWTTNEIQQKRATQLFDLAGSLSANDAIIGRHMIHALLTDVGYGADEEDTLEALSKALPLTKARPKNSLEYPELVDTIVSHHTYARFPQVFRRAYDMVSEAGRDPALALLESLRSLALKFLPLLRFRDFKGGKRIQWNSRDFVEVREQGAPVPVATRAESLTEKVLQQIMARELSGQGHLEVFQTYGMPWMGALLTRMPREVTVEERKMDIYVYVACLAILTNGGYVDFARLARLHRDLPVSQERLLQLQIRSTFELRTICRNTVLYKLHQDLPTKVQGAKLKRKRETDDDDALNALLREAEHKPWHDLNSVQLLDEEEAQERVERPPSMVVPVTVRTRWSAQEMDCVPTGGPLQQDYMTYIRNCQREGIPDRRPLMEEGKRKVIVKELRLLRAKNPQIGLISTLNLEAKADTETGKLDWPDLGDSEFTPGSVSPSPTDSTSPAPSSPASISAALSPSASSSAVPEVNTSQSESHEQYRARLEKLETALKALEQKVKKHEAQCVCRGEKRRERTGHTPLSCEKGQHISLGKKGQTFYETTVNDFKEYRLGGRDGVKEKENAQQAASHALRFCCYMAKGLPASSTEIGLRFLNRTDLLRR